MKDKIHIRQARIEDLKQILQFSQLLFEYDYQFDDTLNLRWTHGAEGKKYFSDHIRKKNLCIFLAECEGEIIGYLAGEKAARATYRKKMEYGELENVYIQPEWRSKGVGKLLMNAFLEWCKAHKIKRVTVIASADNTQAIEFYKRCGFEPYTLTLELEQ